ncbi:UDP-N-acetylmuramate--L-alanine ligase [Candidatus Gottesmanbacteria bacterium]|nr:UDP-N-acetylmuramate--L-alanine ligase [Candidatus Gottesmanbacteria bacterium]
MDTIDLKKIKKIHFVGIKGIAMAALALWAKEAGFSVTGSDIDEHFPSDSELVKAAITVDKGFYAAHIDIYMPNLVIYTGAHEGRDNVEVQKAIELNIPVLPHGKALGAVMNEKRQISVAGSHGKTTTAAMIATILFSNGLDPSYAVGCGEIFGLGAGGHFGNGEFFVAEGDEYVTDPGHNSTPRFLWQHPELLVVTNIDFDHPDVYASLADVKEAFVRLQRNLVDIKTTIVNADERACDVLRRTGAVVSYGFSSQADYQIVDISYRSMRTFYSLKQKGKKIASFSLRVTGKHNALNGAAAAIACHTLGLSWEKIETGLLGFTGTKRRFEKLGEKRGILYYDDYAHHPKEIEATLSGARLWYPKRRIIAVFQPHTYSRTKALLKEFGRSFYGADRVLVSDIYASARESDTMEVTSQVLVDEINKDKTTTFYAKGAIEVISYLKKEVRPNDIVIFMGAGDIYSWEKDVIDALGA